MSARRLSRHEASSLRKVIKISANYLMMVMLFCVHVTFFHRERPLLLLIWQVSFVVPLSYPSPSVVNLWLAMEGKKCMWLYPDGGFRIKSEIFTLIVGWQTVYRCQNCIFMRKSKAEKGGKTNRKRCESPVFPQFDGRFVQNKCCKSVWW